MPEGERRFVDPSEPFIGAENCRVCDFWRWAYSDLLSNTNRPLVAEYLVGAALEVLSQPRVEWDTVDFEYRGRGVEVKSAVYVQTWAQDGPSTIRFEIGEKHRWDEEDRRHEEEVCRHADCYIFCLLTEKDRALVDPLDLSQWKFYVVATAEIDRTFGSQKTVALSRIRDRCTSVSYTCLKAEVDRVLFPGKVDSAATVSPGKPEP
ncbi:MAG: hypothetical protein ABFC38_14215 [Methanospirillum sp.]